jgi:hypothetical protein
MDQPSGTKSSDSHNCFYYTSKTECAIPDDNRIVACETCTVFAESTVFFVSSTTSVQGHALLRATTSLQPCIRPLWRACISVNILNQV